MKRTIGEESKAVRSEILKTAGGYALPIFWDESGIVKHNGTAFILNTGERVFGVTAAHVVDEYMKDVESGVVNVCRLASINVPLQQRLISKGSKDYIDVATFELTQRELAEFSGRTLSGDQDLWPPAPPKEGWAAVVAGYPGVERIQRAQFECSFGVTCFNIPVSSVSEYQFVCAFERQHWIDEFGKGLPGINFDFGGISGAPVLSLIMRDSGIATWRLAGVAYQAGGSEISEGILFANHARIIGSDGNVCKST
ncbi:MAG: hypothetical protein Q7U82_05200 [Gammaproteobacteria bacterium]|nr:hypothetical protein [Gammaproteobacteria bacterium]